MLFQSSLTLELPLAFRTSISVYWLGLSILVVFVCPAIAEMIYKGPFIDEIALAVIAS